MSEIYFKTPKKTKSPPFSNIVKSTEIPGIFNPKYLKNGFYKSKRLSQPDSKANIQRNWLFESPFCKLLNESEREPVEKYQILGKETFSVSL